MLAPWKESYDKPTLPTKICIVKAMVFPIVEYECESGAIKKAELWKLDAFELWCWRRLLRVPWKARRSNQSVLKEINPEYSLEGLMLKLQYFGHLVQRADWTEQWTTIVTFKKKSLGFYPAKQLQDTDRLVPWTTMLLFKIVAKAHRAWSFELEEELWRGGGHCAERTQFLSKSWFFSGVCRDPGQKVSTTKVMLLTFWPLWLTQPHIWQLLFM